MPGQEERRLSQRTKIDRLTYIELPSGNGGIVKDVSEGGLGFCAVAPLDTPDSITLTIRVSSSGVSKRVKATADLVWTDDNRKCGGLRFTHLPNESLAQIRKWHFESARRSEAKEPLAVPHPKPVLFPTPPLYVLEQKNSAGEHSNSKQSAPPEHSKLVKIATPSFPHPVIAATRGTPARMRNPSLLIVAGVAILAGVVGFMSNTWYTAIRGRSAPNAASAGQQTSHVLTQVLASSKPSAPAAPPGPAASVAAARQGEAFADDAPAQRRPFETALAKPAGGSADIANSVETSVASYRAPREPNVDFFFVQVGTYAKEGEAQNLVERLRRQSFVAYASELGGTKLYRVQLGPYTTDEAADLAQSALQRAGFDSYVRESATSK